MGKRRDKTPPSGDPPASAEPPHNPFAVLKGLVPPGAGAERSDEGPARKPLPRPVVRARVTVRREGKGRGGKPVTLAEGPGLAGVDLESLAREAARALGTGARVEDHRLVVQGDQPDRLAAWLEASGFASVARGN
jgi:translation initiation factor 1